jgi:hypothetical protein
MWDFSLINQFQTLINYVRLKYSCYSVKYPKEFELVVFNFVN